MLVRILDGFFFSLLLTADVLVLIMCLTPFTIWFLPLYIYLTRYPHVALFNGVAYGD